MGYKIKSFYWILAYYGGTFLGIFYFFNIINSMFPESIKAVGMSLVLILAGLILRIIVSELKN